MVKEVVFEILIFKTNIYDAQDVENVSAILNAEAKIKRWNIDLDDVDKVLRVITCQLSVNDIIRLVSKAGYSCEELQD